MIKYTNNTEGFFKVLKRLLFFVVGAVAWTSCSLVGSGKPEWGYEKNAIELVVKSDPKLNLYQDRVHSLMICVFQLRDLNGFNQLVDERNGLSTLLECGRFDPAVTYAKRVIAQPSLDSNEIMDRTEGAKYIGIVAGYYELRKETAVRYLQVPVSLLNNPKKLTIELVLGPKAIKEMGNQ